MTTACDPIEVAGIPLANRIAMSPMTRSRAYGPGNSPTELMATYYHQRAGAGLIGEGYPNTPGLHSDEQVAEEVVPAVRENVARHRKINGGGTDSGSDQAEDIAL